MIDGSRMPKPVRVWSSSGVVKFGCGQVRVWSSSDLDKIGCNVTGSDLNEMGYCWGLGAPVLAADASISGRRSQIPGVNGDWDADSPTP